MGAVWKVGSRMKVRDVSENLFVFQFSDEDDRRRILATGPWSFDNNLVVLKNFVGDPANISLDRASFWIHIYDLPLKGITREVGHRIGNEGEEIDIDEGAVGWGRFLRIRVQLDITKPLRRAMRISFSGLDPVWLRFKYERLPRKSYFCGKLGHNEKDCALLLRAKEEGKQAEYQYGDWLRAGPDRASQRVRRDPGGTVESSSGASTSAKEKEKLSSPARSKSRTAVLETHGTGTSRERVSQPGVVNPEAFGIAPSQDPGVAHLPPDAPADHNGVMI